MSFTRQILVFIAIWALLIYIFLTKLNATGAKETEEVIRLNRALSYLETSKSLDKDLRQLLDEYTNDANGDTKTDLLKKINTKFQEVSGESSMYIPKSQQIGIPSIEYEQTRRRVGNNIEELWNYISAEGLKIEKFVKNEDPQQALKQISSFIQLATEQKR
jgi:glycoprotein 6-alpha-L-fucosyltransferase